MKSKWPDMVLFFLVVFLIAIGVIIIFSASTSTALAMTREHPDPYYFLRKQMLWVSVGALGMFMAYLFDIEKLRRLTPWLYAGSVALLALVIVRGIGMESGGARRWLQIGPLGFQPSEMAKVTLVLFVSWFVTRRQWVTTSFVRTVLPLLAMTVPAIALVFKEPDFGTCFVMLMICGIMLCIAGTRIAHMVILAGFLVPPVLGLMILAPYRIARWTAFFNPWKDPLGGGYHIIQGLIALGSGGFWGLGLGAGRQKFFYLPEQHTDYIFAVLGEEGGFLATALVLLLFLFLAARGVSVALRQDEPHRKLLAAGLTTLLAGQALLNMAMVTSLLPPAGVALPFLSYGGSSLVASMIAAGLLLNLSRAQGKNKIGLRSDADIF